MLWTSSRRHKGFEFSNAFLDLNRRRAPLHAWCCKHPTELRLAGQCAISTPVASNETLRNMQFTRSGTSKKGVKNEDKSFTILNKGCFFLFSQFSSYVLSYVNLVNLALK